MEPPEFIAREKWNAREPRYIHEMKEVKYVQVTSTDSDSCRNKEECIKLIQDIQNKHMDKEGEPDIKYKEYADMQFVYGFCNGSSRAAVIEYGRRFPNRVVPNSFIITPGQDVFVGRGWEGGTSVQTEKKNSNYEDPKYVGKTIVIAYIGRKDSSPSSGVLLTAASIVTYGLGHNIIAPNVDLIRPDEEEEGLPTPGQMKAMAAKLDVGLLGKR